jgi:diguanylate cyclase (GGDEF)-like protein
LNKTIIDRLNREAFDIKYSNLEEASALTEQAVSMAAELNYTMGIAWGQLNSGLIDMERGHLEESHEKIKQAQHVFNKIGKDVRANAAVLNSLGLVNIRLGKMNQAFIYLQDSLKYCETHSLKSMENTAINYLGILQYKSGRYNQALRFFQKSFKRRTDYKTVNVLNNLGCTYRALGQNEKALEFLNKALLQAGEEGMLDARIAILEEMGLTYGQMKDYKQGIMKLQSALDICAGSNRRQRPDLYIHIAEQCLQLKNYDMAEENLQNADELISDSNRVIHREIYLLLSQLEEFKGNAAEALSQYKRYQQLTDSIKSEDLEENLWLLETDELRKMNTRVAAISKMGQELTAFLERREILNTLSRSFFNLFSIDVCLIGEIPDGDDCLHVDLYTSPEEMSTLDSLEIINPREIMSWVAGNNSGLLINDIEKEIGRYISSYEENLLALSVSSVLCLPFESGYGRGAIGIYSSQKNKFNEDDRYFMEMLCSFGSIALNNAFQAETIRIKNRELTMLNRYDSLTGIYNRTHILSVIEQSWKQCRRTSSYIHVMLLDADHFKKINDTWGHNAGDECLKMIGIVLKNNLQRSSDSYGRYGGEEFLFSLLDLTVDEALDQAEKIRKTVENYPVIAGSDTIQLSVSIGVCSTIPGFEDKIGLNDIIREADSCMYRSKEEGRNLVRSVIL